ncbi:MAG: mannose-1-phosphate guanylyltransferase [Saprospiraceae bacterium]|nr:mannose-1-phosphate guanylyltransferase [Saprospiraceae bacterium]
MKDANTYVAIMAGGIGSRFWPSSRTNRPKQFLDIMGTGESLIQTTFNRFRKLVDADRIFIVTNGIYKDLVKSQLPELTDNQIICEPSRNNTAPCVALTALKIHALNADANLIIAPSDHLILKEDVFVDKIKTAVDFAANNDALLTLGIQPSRPDTGYGYINYKREGDSDIKKVNRFTEKPNAEVAQSFLDSGDYVWNAGIFIWSTSSIIEAFKKHAGEIHRLLSSNTSVFNTDKEQDFIDSEYPKTPSISVDYAIMEQAENIYTLPAEIGWSDLGTWGSLYAESEKDEAGNVINNITHKHITNVNNSYIRTSADKLVVIKGLDDYIVIDEDDVLLIYPKKEEQNIKQVNGNIKDLFGDKYL